MKKSFLFILITVIIAVFMGCSGTVVYDKENNLRLDYIVPNTKQPLDGYPAVVLIHGMGGSKDTMKSMAKDIAEHGYFTISFTWRVPNGTSVKWPAQIDDALNAMAWLTNDPTHASKWSRPNPFKINPTKIGTMGFSAGGTFSLWIGHDSRINAVVSLAGATNLETIYRYYAFNEKEDDRDLNSPSLYKLPTLLFLNNLLGTYSIEDINMDGIPDYDPDYFNASPINHPPLRVPVLLIHGKYDSSVPPSQSRTFYNKMQSFGGVCDMVIYNSGHGGFPGLPQSMELAEPMYVNSGITYSEETDGIQNILDFFDATLLN